jgi:hypothetical protein
VNSSIGGSQDRFLAKMGQPQGVSGVLPDVPGQNLALIVSCAMIARQRLGAEVVPYFQHQVMRMYRGDSLMGNRVPW